MSTVLVAGATGPIGRAVCRTLASRGHRVVAHFRSSGDSADRLVAELGVAGGHVAIGADLLAPGAAERLVREARPAPGDPLTAVVNCAWPQHGSAPLLAPDDGHLLERSLDGVRAHLSLCRAAMADLRRTQGALVLLGGALASRLHPGLGHYSIGKAAATTATLAIALEEGRHGVRANVVAPGRVDVGDGDLAESDPAFAALDHIGRERRALRDLPTPDDVAGVVAALLGNDGVALTGQVLGVAGGEPL